MTEEKVTFLLNSASDLPQISKNKVTLSRQKSMLFLVKYVKQKLNIQGNQSIHLFFNNFAIYPDWTAGDVADHSPGQTTLDIYYSSGQVFG
ncbi:hypothetical protein TVAG_144400 [Trichomonas vaginalis G3]|uniref:Ubiquitin-like protein ATG12 n=1 Tax=Trichomonas vaginalis (strain ATCC PRA-98 / G3) TaxID=412133 RepID=A2FHD3_TRIV3|nr:ubiquitin-like family [Trichomonas vaginalis G3]EAX95691.1 hypothetical protein TVAG_144400 [Trichomonas vaginalis G3]KAI5546789.1 ubiquitin-like family [Trichomonas vaginalis G3]|eukprot:XP_001308621.1 hypothetical protein [Trichomonas vaginalis G3]